MIVREPRFFYVGMVSTDAYVKAIRQDAFVGAASGKMSAVVSALRLVKRRAVLVSLPFITSGPKWQASRIVWRDGFPALFLPACRSPAARKFQGTFSFAWFALRVAGKHDKVLFYNHAAEYSLALLILRIRKIAVFQDIEDLPTSAEDGLRGFLNRLGYKLMFEFASTRKVTVSNQIGKALNLRNFLAIQGVAAVTETENKLKKWDQLKGGAPLRVHYGGTLMASTGLNLFCAMVEHLDAIVEPGNRSIEFVVTGVGNLDAIRDLALLLRTDTLRIEVHQEISRDAYIQLLDGCHAGLSLKSPDSEISSTTFPSKVVEITSRGLALVATKVSDVGEIFTDETAWLLPEFTAQDLSETILEMAQKPSEVCCRALAGQALARARFSPLAVGKSLAEFLESGADT